MRRLGVELPSSCLVFEDSISGVKAGKNAQMKVCWIPDARMKIPDDIEVEMRLADMTEFQPELFGFPSYPSMPPLNTQ